MLATSWRLSFKSSANLQRRPGSCQMDKINGTKKFQQHSNYARVLDTKVSDDMRNLNIKLSGVKKAVN